MRIFKIVGFRKFSFLMIDMIRHDFHWLDEGEHEAPTVRSLGVRLSKLSVEGEGDGEGSALAHGRFAGA